MEDIRFQIKLPGYEEQEEEDGKTSETSEKPKADKRSKRSKKGKARPESRPRRRRSAAADRCDRCCYCCVLCCESVFFTVGSAIRILMSVVVVGLMFWTALYVYTISSEAPRNATNTSLLRTLDVLSDGYRNPARSSEYLGDPAGSEADGGLPGGSDDLNKTESSSASSSESGGSPVTLADSDNGSNSPHGPGGSSDDLVAPRGSSYHHGDDACSDNSCPDNTDCVRSGNPVHISDDTTDFSNAADPSDVMDPSIGPGTLVDTPDEQGDE